MHQRAERTVVGNNMFAYRWRGLGSYGVIDGYYEDLDEICHYVIALQSLDIDDQPAPLLGREFGERQLCPAFGGDEAAVCAVVHLQGPFLDGSTSLRSCSSALDLRSHNASWAGVVSAFGAV
jgi:hypothetical protein